VPFRLSALGVSWPTKRSRADDPYWESFINTSPADLANSVPEIIRRAPAGNVFPTRTELHTPEITSRHVKEMARYLGADLVGITALKGDDEPLPFAVVCAVRADHDPRTSPGVGGQVPVQNGLFVTFVLSAWIRELGFRAISTRGARADQLAARAGLGTLGAEGKLMTREFGAGVHVADVILTDLPLVPDG
jgi:hypothetical protein